MSARSVSALKIWWLLAGFTVWAFAFAVLYAMLSVGCRFGWDGLVLTGGLSLQRTVLAGLFLISLAANALVVWLASERRRALGPDTPASERLLVGGGWLAALAALGATAISLGPVFFLSPCI